MEQNWSDNERLNLCAVGQMAAPVQTVWIGASLVKHLRVLFSHVAPMEPGDALHDLKQLVFSQSETFFTDIPRSMPDSSMPKQHTLRVVMPCGSLVEVRCDHQVTVRALLSAEGDLLHVPLYELAACLPESDSPLDWDVPLHTMELVHLRSPWEFPLKNKTTRVVSFCSSL